MGIAPNMSGILQGQAGGAGPPKRATGATAGIPGAFTPAGTSVYSVAAANTAPVVVASPATNWTAGQYVTTRSGDMYWNGTTWVAGRHP